MTIVRAGLLKLLEAFDRLEVAYMVVGSIASCMHGLYRATADIDFVIALDAERVDDLAGALRAEFYVDEEQIRTALRFRRSVNVIHLASAYKFDLFPVTGDAFSQREFSRRRYQDTDIFGGGAISLAVCSPEDLILGKLRWYEKGGRTSEQQWHDLLGVVAARRDVLDHGYLREWAAYLGLPALLEAALAERHDR